MAPNLDQIFEGARQAGVDIEGSAHVQVDTDPIAGGERVTLTIPVDNEGQVVPGGGGVVTIQVYQEELSWHADTRHEETITKTSAKSPREAVRDALAPIVDESGGLIYTAPVTSGGPSQWEPEVSAMRTSDDIDPDIVEGDSPFDQFEPEISIYQRREEPPYTGGDVEDVPRDPVVRGVPSPDDGDNEGGQTRAVGRVPVEPEFDEPDRRRLPPDDDSMLTKLVKIGIPLVVAILLVIFGINLFGNGEPEVPEATPPPVAEEPTDQVSQGEDDPLEEEPLDPPPPEEEEPPPSPSSAGLADLTKIGLTNGEGRPVQPGTSFVAFYHLLFIPEDDLINELPQPLDAETVRDLLALAGDPFEEPFTRTGVMANQFFDDPAAGGDPQTTAGYAVDVDEGVIEVSLVGQGPNYVELMFGQLQICPTFPSCEDSTLTLISLGGPPDLDIEAAHADARAIFEDRSAVDNVGEYGWILEIFGGVEQLP